MFHFISDKRFISVLHLNPQISPISPHLPHHVRSSSTGVTVPKRLPSAPNRLAHVGSPSKHLPRPLSSHPRLPWPASRYPPFHSTHHHQNIDDCFFKSQALQSHLQSQMWPQWQLRLQEKERYFLLF